MENASAASSEFARVNAVSAGSPADEAGLRFGDLIKQFGNVNSTNNEKLGKVAEEVAQNEQVSTPIPSDAHNNNFCRGK